MSSLFDESDLPLVLAALASASLWLLAAAVVLWTRSPPRPAVGPRTLDLGPERPAVANFLVHDFRVTDEALPATLIDLAARNVVDIEQRGPDAFYVRLRASNAESLTSYERRVLVHLERLARDGVVPAEALTTGPENVSERWRKEFTSEVVEDAQGQGLARDTVGGGIFYVLTAASAIPGLLVGLTWGVAMGGLVVFAAFSLLGWIRARNPQRETPAGLEAASRWLGVRAELAVNPVFATHSPLQVELWSRLLAYGAALGVASGASRPLPMGVESDTDAWSAYGGRWRHVRISYPHLWPPAWGKDPVLAFLAGVGLAAGLGLFLYLSGLELLDAGLFGAVPFAIACAGVMLAVAAAVMAAADWRTALEVTGPILRLRSFGGEDDDERHYVAVDDGVSERIRAWRIGETLYETLEQGDLITVRLTARLGCVRWIVPAEDPLAAG